MCCIAILLKTVFSSYFLEAKNLCFVTKNFSKSSYICGFILSKKQHNWFYKDLHNSGMVGRGKLPDSSLNCMFSALLIDVQYTLSFQWINFGLKCLLTQLFHILLWVMVLFLQKILIFYKKCWHQQKLRESWY